MKRNKYIMGMMATALLVASCTDFSDYNESYTSGSDESKQTLWENIQGNGQLSQFAELLRKSGFDKDLASSRFYTVWAPLDGTFDADYHNYLNTDSATLLYRFVKSHVANYSHTASGEVSEKVHALNEKSFAFSGNGPYLYDRRTLKDSNLPSINGVLHTLDGSAEFLPNIYEYVFEAESSDSVARYLKRFEERKINLSKSTEGPVVDGVQTYLDSVFDVSNTMTRRLRAFINVEDSNYTMMLPTDAAYKASYDRISKYYNYAASTAYQNLGSLDESVKTQSVKNSYLTDSLTRYAIARSMFFNNNQSRNRWVYGNARPLDLQDTLYTTSGTYYVDVRNSLFPHIVDSVRMSNGMTWIMDSLPQYSWHNWNPSIYVSASRSSTRPKTYPSTVIPTTAHVNSTDIDTARVGKYILSDGTTYYPSISYLDMLVSGDRQAPQIWFYVPGVLSTAYNIYVVTVPANIKMGSTAKSKRYKFSVDVSYSDANGKMVNKDFGTFMSDSARVDTVKIGTITFPVAYDEIPVSSGSANVYPYLHIQSRRSTISRVEWETVDNRLRIAAIIFRPVEYDEYWEEYWKAYYNKPEDE